MGESQGAIVMDEAGKLYRYDARDGHLLGPPIADAGAIGAADLSPSGHILATAAGGQVTLRDAHTGATLATLSTGTEDVTQLVVDDDGHAATGHDDGMMRFWNTRTGALIAARWGHAGHVERLTLRGDRVFSESWDQSVRAWRLATGASLGVVLSNVRGAVAISGDGRLLATGEPEGEVDVWDAASGRLLDRVPTSQVMTALAFVDDDHVIAGGRGGALELLDLSDHPRTTAEIARLAGERTR
jgi:WD40 repeat protein